jgi:hypothetical protein
MRRPISGLAVVLGIVLLTHTGEARAQMGTLGADPFSLYFGYYLPHQAAIAAQPTPMDTINAVQAQRQVAAAADRTGLYDPVSPFGDEDLDPLRPYGRRGSERLIRPHSFATSTVNHRARGTAPPAYYNRHGTGISQYYSNMPMGFGPNRNLAVTRGGGRSAGGSFGMPSAQSSLGPR